MPVDTLYLLDPDVHVAEGYPRFCPACALVSGYLNYYPQVSSRIAIHTVSPVRPRALIVEKLGEDNQGSPVLILAEDSVLPEGVEAQQANGYRFINDERAIVRYLGKTYAAGLSLGDSLN